MAKKRDTSKPAAERPTTVRLPHTWYEVLRTRAFDERRAIADLIREALLEKYPDLPAECAA